MDKKYLKYKSKYLNLRKQIGSGELEDIKRKLTKTDILCIEEGYRQHTGQCWNDSLQQMFTFSNALKDTVQTKLMKLNEDEILKLAELSGRKFILSNEINTPETIENLKNYLREYIKRFKIYAERNQVSYNGKPTVPSTLLPRLKRQDSIASAINAANFGLKIADPTFELPHLPKEDDAEKEDETKVRGGTRTEIYRVLLALSYALLDNDTCIICKDIEIPTIFTNKDLSMNYDYTDEEIDSATGVLLTIQYGKKSFHATCFYSCDEKNVYYDDNNSANRFGVQTGIEECDWKTYMKRLRDEKLLPIIYNKDKMTFINRYYPGYYDYKTDKVMGFDNKVTEDSIGIIKNFSIIRTTTNRTDFIENRNEMFFKEAILQNNLTNIKQYIAVGVNMNKTFNSIPLFYFALSLKNDELTDLLLKSGVDINFKGYSDRSAIQTAFLHDYPYGIRKLSEEGAILEPFVDKNILYDISDRIMFSTLSNVLPNFFTYHFHFKPILEGDFNEKRMTMYANQQAYLAIEKYLYEHYTFEILEKELNRIAMYYPQLWNAKLLIMTESPVTVRDYLLRQTLLQYLISIPKFGVGKVTKDKEPVIKFLLEKGADIKEINEKFIRYINHKERKIEYVNIKFIKDNDMLHLYLDEATYTYLMTKLNP